MYRQYDNFVKNRNFDLKFLTVRNNSTQIMKQNQILPYLMKVVVDQGASVTCAQKPFTYVSFEKYVTYTGKSA
jgi:hypothetical protein